LTFPLRELSESAMVALADALEAGRLAGPYTSFSVQRYVSAQAAEAVANDLERFRVEGLSPASIAYFLRMLAAERADGHRAHDQLELVWTGPEAPGGQSRDTGVVVREMFSRAKQSVLVAGFAVRQGRDIFRALAERMEELPQLHVRMFLNVGPASFTDQRSSSEIVRAFSEDFRSSQWPGKHLPEVYYDPRALDQEGHQRASLHAKCVVVDQAEALVTSANFTEAAQQRNIEVGVRIVDAMFAKALEQQFEGLVLGNDLLRLPGL